MYLTLLYLNYHCVHRSYSLTVHTNIRSLFLSLAISPFPFTVPTIAYIDHTVNTNIRPLSLSCNLTLSIYCPLISQVRLLEDCLHKRIDKGPFHTQTEEHDHFLGKIAVSPLNYEIHFNPPTKFKTEQCPP